MTLGMRLSVPLEGPLRLPCHSYSASGLRIPASEKRLLFYSDSRPSPFSAKFSISGRFQHGFLAVKQQHSRRATVVRASGDPGGSPRPVVGPAELKTPTGQVLSEVMRSHPHLLSSTIDEELNKLCLNRDAEEKKAASRSPASPDKILYMRIAELKEKERRQAIEDIMYCLIVQKFGDRHIDMMPKIITSSSPKVVTLINAPYRGPKHLSFFSPDALDMVVGHVSLILLSDNLGHATRAQMSKSKLVELYTNTIMYGYYVKRIDERYQLDLTMNTLPKVKNLPNMNGKKVNRFFVRITPDDGDGFGKAGDAKDGGDFGKAGDAKDGGGFGKAGDANDGDGFGKAGDANDGDGFGKAGDANDGDGFGKAGDANDGDGFRKAGDAKNGAGFGKSGDANDGAGFGNAGDAMEKDCSLMGYVWYLDTETLQRYATIRSKEAGAVIEKQRQGLFGPPDLEVSRDGKFGAAHDVVAVKSQCFIRLLLEAALFGSFLWEAEEYIENKYPIAESRI